ncbi:MFS transporter [Candidatus Lokiarchaeum ossiferum]|uniref:MFS transporter n=1 Tax=Candidatus Lokiarchaeum ossiferum TaxID=2951803 RepID=UPI00352E535C
MNKTQNFDINKKTKRQNLWVFMIGNLISGFGESCINIAYIPFLYEVTDNNLFITGLFSTLFTVLWFIPAPISGKLSDKFGRKKMMIISKPIALVGLGILFFVNKNNLYLLIVSIFLRAIGFMSSNINREILIAESNSDSKNGLGRIFGILAFLYFGSTIGGAVFVNQTGYSFVTYFMIFGGITCMIWIMEVLFITDNTTYLQKRTTENSRTQKNWREIFSNSKIRTAIIFLTLDFFVWDVSNSVLNAGLQRNYGFTLENLAFFSIWFNVSTMLFQIPAGKLTDKYGKKKILIVSEAVGSLIFAIHIFTALLWSGESTTTVIVSMVLTQILFGVVASTFIPSESMILTDLDESRKGESYGMVSFVRGFGALPTGAIGGFLMGSVHFITPFIVSIVGIVLIIIYLVKFGHRFEDEEKIEHKIGNENESKPKIESLLEI